MSNGSGHWDAELFRREGHRMVDWIAGYLDGGNREYPVLSKVKPGEVSGKLPKTMPQTAEDPEAVWRDFLDIIMPGVTHWNHPGFMAYFGITGSGPGILGELLSAALDVNGMLWRTCPSATELELTVLDWMRSGLELPDDFFGFLTDTASISSMLALAAAREAADPLKSESSAWRGATICHRCGSTPRTRPTPRSPRAALRSASASTAFAPFRTTPTTEWTPTRWRE